MVRAMVIAGEATDTRAVVLPTGTEPVAAFNVAHGAHVRAYPTFHATGFVHPERLVRDEPLGEHGP